MAFPDSFNKLIRPATLRASTFKNLSHLPRLKDEFGRLLKVLDTPAIIKKGFGGAFKGPFQLDSFREKAGLIGFPPY